MNNRQRRAAKARRRVADQHARPRTSAPQDEPRHSQADRAAAASSALRLLILLRSGHPDTKVDPAVARKVIDAYRAATDADQQHAIDDQLLKLVRYVVDGWTPSDLYEVSRRRLPPEVVEHLLAVVADETGRHSRSATHPDWYEQLRQLNATPTIGGSRAWAQHQRLDWSDAHDALIELLVLLARLPLLEQVLPPPGSAPSGSFAAAHVDEGVLRKIRGLLAKAEATSFDAEAEALTAKAQQLMTKHAVDSALTASTGQAHKRTPVLRRIWLDTPYVDSKSMLVEAVARSNHCRCLFTKTWDFVSLVGHDTDLDNVELLSTSLLVQATRAMTAKGSQTTRSGVSQTRSFRRSFLMSFAVRIGERLEEAASAVETDADAERGGALLPVLAARDDAVDDAMTKLFPHVVTRSVSISNSSGWNAGRVAADLARLDVRDALDSEVS